MTTTVAAAVEEQSVLIAGVNDAAVRLLAVDSMVL
jgi:hypothetical protein